MTQEELDKIVEQHQHWILPHPRGSGELLGDRQMSELKDYDILDIEAIDDERVKRETAPGKVVQCSRVYLKSDVDKVIAELEMKLSAAKLVLRLNEPKALYSNLDTMGRLNHKIDVVERRELHQKYKRCLAMANYWVAVSYQCVDDKHRQSAERHHRKWLELAGKFEKWR